MTRLRDLAKWLYWYLSGPSTEHLMMGDPREDYDAARREWLKREPKW